ncbi:FAD-dependent oxidoreductase [Methylohalobius crimeensis]|uniref:FAD-dependent oxidoreductase n=1 Tax=Methylohalobius crimeensis TaxID=244365 RepID=UPI0003B6E6AB|nr:FAD-dependent oxidoreductase [Methylohalobius crimeensis]
MTQYETLALGIEGFAYEDLYDPLRLKDLTAAFDRFVEEKDPRLLAEFEEYRVCQGDGMAPEKVSELLVRMAPFVGGFLARLFRIEEARAGQMVRVAEEMGTVFRYREEIVGKEAPKRFKREKPREWDIDGLNARFESLLAALAGDSGDREKTVAEWAVRLKEASTQALQLAEAGDLSAMADEIEALRRRIGGHPRTREAFAAELEMPPEAFLAALYECLLRWTFAASRLPDMQPEVADWASFKKPERTDVNHLVEHDTVSRDAYQGWGAPEGHHRRRVGFHLTDDRYRNLRPVLYEVDHCIYCHERDTDSCAKGMRDKKTGGYKTSPFDKPITGCPLEEKISEMHWVKRQGDDIGALALVIVDNPMCPGTGHRICNECMKGCIYQKTEPVNIPEIETHVLTAVLDLPYGFEIYTLLTRWNPLNVRRPHALPYNGKNVLVVGMGPAGYTLAHYLSNEGFGVVGIDGLKIEPLPKKWLGDENTPPQPVRDFQELYEDLNDRVMLGFGGVAEYGITVRWDKNFLKVIYLTLARRRNFRCYGGVRFGGTLTINEAWDLGFDHIAIAAGAGKPTIIPLKNNLIRGIRKASDFLMALQSSGAAKTSSMANLQVRLPAGVIGGGLTAIDTATELLAYYPVQVEKILHRYETLVAEMGEDKVRAGYDAEERIILDEFLAHGRAVRAERSRAEAAGEKPDFLPLLNEWGGVTVFYRRGMRNSPAYRENHEEIREALEEGIVLAEGMSPLEAVEDDFGHLKAVKFQKMAEADGRWQATEETVEVPLRSLMVAAGTSPNTLYQEEHPETFEMAGKFYRPFAPEWIDEIPELQPVEDERLWPKLSRPAPFTSYRRQGKYITFYGDNNPIYAGNVVRAMASAKDSYPYIVRLFEKELAALEPAGQADRDRTWAEFRERLDDLLLAHIVEVIRLAPTIVEVVVKAPMAAKHFAPGQFYRIQNFESLAPTSHGTCLAAEGLALTGAWVDKERGVVSLIVLEMGSSSKLCSLWQPGDPLVVMGVTGAPTEIPSGQTVLLVGGGLGNAVLFSIGKALKAAGNQVLYFAGYRDSRDVFKVKEIEEASDVIVWAVDDLPGNQPIKPTRSQDKSFTGNIVEAMLAYAEGKLGATPIHFDDVDHLIVIGSDRMMKAVKEARYGALAPHLKRQHTAIGSINSPMQCMLKGVCGQCLCRHQDPETGEEYFVYSCYNQDQALDRVDFDHLNARLKQNTVQEKLGNLWLDYVLEKPGG